MQSICAVDINTSERECEDKRHYGLYLNENSIFGGFIGFFCGDDSSNQICKSLKKL